jgi:hypothetical protein
VGDDPALEEDLDGLRSRHRRLKMRGHTVRVLMLIILGVAATLIVSILVFEMVLGRLNGFHVGVALFQALWCLLMWWSIRRFPAFGGKPELIAEYLRIRRCPSCAYSLGDSTPEEDGCGVGRECGAAGTMAEGEMTEGQITDSDCDGR